MQHVAGGVDVVIEDETAAAVLSASVFGLSGSRPHPLHLLEVPRGAARTTDPSALSALQPGMSRNCVHAAS
ncbi:MAG: hypothetical protein F4103_17645 [Boseongicola sp. SB0673_bin_14]|nr:hypothetical protein [Boseongicola sp. SB0667_bin_21]MYI70481.1 hypothetical protein [Boseongicola sp. SB0673_bin_14]